jgi:hypothetical protein
MFGRQLACMHRTQFHIVPGGGGQQSVIDAHEPSSGAHLASASSPASKLSSITSGT